MVWDYFTFEKDFCARYLKFKFTINTSYNQIEQKHHPFEYVGFARKYFPSGSLRVENSFNFLGKKQWFLNKFN